MARSIGYLDPEGRAAPAGEYDSATVRLRRFKQAARQAGACPRCQRFDCEHAFVPASRITPGKWSDRQTLLFILATCGLFWAAVVGAVVGALAR